MDEGLATPACLLGKLGPWGSFAPGELALTDGEVTFTPQGGSEQGHLFSAPIDEVKVRFPKLYFGLGLQLVVSGNRYRFWFVSLSSAAGETTGAAGDKQTIVVGNSFKLSEVGTARSATRIWRAALSHAGA
jgi:hypothetical protein